MDTEKTVFGRGVIEIPPELLGPSNEEILQKEGREDTPRRRRAAARPSKRERMLKKQGISRAEMSKIAEKYSENAKPKAPHAEKKHHASFSSAVKPAHDFQAQTGLRPASKLSVARKKLESLFTSVTRRQAEPETPRVEPKREPPKAVTPPTPPSGRVLRGSFGAKPSETTKAQVYSAAELSRIRMEERAKKIRAELARKSGPGPLVDAEGNPVKRPRGRPRKNPLP